MSGPKQIMVTKDSAERIGDSIRDFDHLPSCSDHRGLVRFDDPKDARYLSVINKLKAIANPASEDIGERFRIPRQER